MSTSHEASAQLDASSHAQSPQVVVRAGKTYVCSACGTLVEIPAEVVGQLVLATSQAPEADPPKQAPSQPTQNYASVSGQQPGGDTVDKRTTSTNRRPPHPKRPKPPTKGQFVGQRIDGLRVPSAKELDRALAWVSFHLRVLDRQVSEIKRLQKLLKQQSTTGVPCPRPRGHAQKTTQQETHQPHDQQHPSHAHEDVDMPPKRDDQHKRGPP